MGALLSGIVMLGTSQAISFVLMERGINVRAVSYVWLATIPYAWKFAMSPFIRSMISRYRHHMDIVKVIAYASQVLVLILLSALGWLAGFCTLPVLGTVIFVIVTAISIHDVITAHIKLCLFEQGNFGLITAIENAGFRIGMFLSGACILYLANFLNWTLAYIVIGGISLAVMLTTFCMPNMQDTEEASTQQIRSIGSYVRMCFGFFKKHGILAMTCLLIAFKFADSCINCLKSMFLYSLGVEKLAFANIAHLVGVVSMMISGIAAGYTIDKYGSKKSVPLAFVLQGAAALGFIYLAMFPVSIPCLTLIVNIETFIFGFSNVVFRSLMADLSCGNVNIYTMALSTGSALRIISYGIGGMLADLFSWTTVYLVCMFSNLPGLVLYMRWKYKGKDRSCANS
jgi:PAT family beta-lactamase induction signal transducer AmpG